jgi:phosphoribosyl 1,2-cyclic phosphodiesterase
MAVGVGDEPPIVVDLGTGLRPFGHDLEARAGPGGAIELTALLSHLHWDHIFGLPFFTPLLDPGGRMELYGPAQDSVFLHEAIETLVRPPFFPVTVKELQGVIDFREVTDDDFCVGSATVKSRLVPHVGTTLGFRIEADGGSVAFVCDHQAPDDTRSVAPGVLELCDGADLVVHDAQYTETEYQAKSDWGHSTIAYAVHVAAEAGARTLALFHHDPTRTDEELDRLLAGARDLPEAARLGEVVAAAEGLELNLGRP